MNRRRTILLAIALTLGIGLALWWCYTNFESVPVEVNVGYRGEARYNDLLAVQDLFDSLDAPLRFVDVRRELPALDATLVLLDRTLAVDDDRSSELLQWVSAGGHVVVVVADTDTDSNDPLLVTWRVKAHAGEGATISTKASLVADEHLNVEFRSSRTLSYAIGEPLARVGSQAGWHLLTFDHGDGRVTALSDHHFMRNPNIGRLDNAALLWRLTHLQRSGAVWIVRGASTPSLWQPIIDRGWPLIVSLAVLVVGILWAASRRFGPLLPAPTREPPRLLEHVAASGAFYWREGARGVLLDAVRDSVLRTIEYRRPGWLAAGNRDQRIANITGLAQEQIARAFALAELDDARTFTDTIATLEAIRKRL
ncbi:MAG: hypothetical protein ACI8W7_000099 [Gammaproteobacteria bacterium]